MKGKNKCKILKQIRQRIADENDIPYVTRECTYQGECTGTCPKCESELRYLEQELEKRRRLGKAVTVAAMAATMTLGAAGCVDGIEKNATQGLVEANAVVKLSAEENAAGAKLPEPGPEDPEPLAGRIVCPTEDGTREMIAGEIAAPEDGELQGEPVELEGDVAWIEPEEPEDGDGLPELQGNVVTFDPEKMPG